MAVEHPAEDEELRSHLRRREPEALALASVILRQLTGILVAVQARDEGGQRAELTQPPEPLERRDDAFGERLLDALDREVPRRCPHDPGHAASG